MGGGPAEGRGSAGRLSLAGRLSSRVRSALRELGSNPTGPIGRGASESAASPPSEVSSCPGTFARRRRLVDRTGAPRPRRLRESRGGGNSLSGTTWQGVSDPLSTTLPGLVSACASCAVESDRLPGRCTAGRGDIPEGGTRSTISRTAGSPLLGVLGVDVRFSSKRPNPNGSSPDPAVLLPFLSGLVSDKGFFLQATKGLQALRPQQVKTQDKVGLAAP